MKRRLEPLPLLACERGFLDNAEGAGFSDSSALDILVQMTAAKTSAANAFLADRAEIIIGEVIEAHEKSKAPLHLKLKLMTMQMALAKARLDAGRKLPTEEPEPANAA